MHSPDAASDTICYVSGSDIDGKAADCKESLQVTATACGILWNVSSWTIYS